MRILDVQYGIRRKARASDRREAEKEIVGGGNDEKISSAGLCEACRELRAVYRRDGNGEAAGGNSMVSFPSTHHARMRREERRAMADSREYMPESAKIGESK